ncbi:uncharacterized protein LOC129750098 [Uranotaenia lowii]|uniref:uncharacterized protein LOC129750098 n=1 Tax=Uranotaenia lowii TaxID=190385 RepID=UPI00247AFA1D|nr:uncharacterized protein LOC129750098 [Uranotaenia lowii]
MSEIAGGRRQPDYFVGTDGIPRSAVLIGFLAADGSRSSKTMDNNNTRRSSAAGTDPLKRNKCLYNDSVKSLNNSVTTTGRVGNPAFRNGSLNLDDSDNRSTIRYQIGGIKSLPSSSISSSNINHNSQSSASGLFGNGPNSGNHIRRFSPSYSSTSNNCTILNPRTAGDRPVSAATGIIRSRNVPPAPIRSNNVTSYSKDSYTAAVKRPLLENRSQRKTSNSISSSDATSISSSTTVSAAADWNRHHESAAIYRGRYDYGSNHHRLAGPCSRFATATGCQKSPSPSKDNRLNYQRAYDRSIFGYNRLDQLVLPPLQI